MEVKPYGFSLEALISAKDHPFMRSIIAGFKTSTNQISRKSIWLNFHTAYSLVFFYAC
jgi:hypothetical protein